MGRKSNHQTSLLVASAPLHSRDSFQSDTVTATPVSSNTSSEITNTSQLTPQLTDARMNHAPAPTAAFAIPLSFVGAILLGSCFMCMHNRRKLKQERLLDAQKLSSMKEKVHLASPYKSAQAPTVIYLSSAPSTPGSERGSYFAKSGEDDIYTPVYARREGEPRQYTRQPFQIPTTIITTPSIRSKNSLSYSHDNVDRGTRYTTPNPRSTKVPASLFKATCKSPAMPPGLGHAGAQVDEEEEGENASVNHSVISSYATLSPMIPSCLSPGMPTHPGKLHLRNDAPTAYDFEKPLPSPYSEKEAYRVVDDVVRSRNG